MRIGDQILSVNDRSLVDVSKSNAIPILKDTEGAVRLTISSDHPTIEVLLVMLAYWYKHLLYDRGSKLI